MNTHSKGTHLLKEDLWKENFFLQLRNEAIPVKILADDNRYRIWGFHFFNREDNKNFDSDFNELLS